MLEKANKLITKILETLIIGMFILLIGTIFSQVILRYFSTFSIAWIDEISRFTLIWATFLAMPLATKYKAHLGVNYFVDLIKVKPLRMVLLLLIEAAILLFNILLIIYGSKMAISAHAMSSMVTQIPMSYIYSILPITSMISIYFTLQEIVKTAKAKGGDA